MGQSAFQPAAQHARQTRRREQRREMRDVGGVAAVLDGKPGPAAVVSPVEDARRRDRRSVHGPERLRRRPAESEEIAVRGITGAQARGQRRQRPVLIAAAEKKLGRVDGAETEEHLSGADGAFTTAGAVNAKAELESVLAGSDAGHLTTGPRLGTQRLGDGEIVEVERVLGADVAADVAPESWRATRPWPGRARRGERPACGRPGRSRDPELLACSRAAARRRRRRAAGASARSRRSASPRRSRLPARPTRRSSA
jgi:hypothetical protein